MVSAPEPELDLVVIGGGPVGVVTALMAARRGLSARVYERATDVYDLPRAVGMDGEIQRALHDAGVGERLAQLTTPIEGAEFVTPDGERLIGQDVPPDTVGPHGHHPTVMFHQPDLEAMLRDEARAAGVDLRLGVEVDAVRATGDGDSVEASASDGPVEARWAVAADGAASPVRKALDIAFVDQGFDQDWLVFDVILKRPLPSLGRLAKQVCDPARPATMVPGHGDRFRWEFQLQPGETADEMTEPGRVWQLLEPWLGPDDAELCRAVVYRFHATVAERMRHGPIFLAGDAAHQMPPFLGQGLCSGIRDAANLTWKLDLVRRGLAGDALLDTYDVERRPHAAGLVAHAVDTGRLIDQLAGRVDSGVGLDAGYGGGRGFPHLTDGLRVGDGARVGKQAPQPRVDGRLFDERLGAGFAVLVEDGTDVAEGVAARWTPLGRIVACPPGAFDRLLPEGGAVVVRPDRYIAAIAADGRELGSITDELLSMLGAG